MSIHLQHISIPYIPSSHSEVWDRDLIFEEGTYYHIKAASGKGKTSLVQTIYGIQNNFKGDILINQKSIKNLDFDSWSALRASTLSTVFQDLKLIEDQTALMNIELKRELTNYYPKEKIVEFASRLNIENLLHRKIDTLSYGERQRVAIVRALMQDYAYILLDEPFSHLDEENILKAISLIHEETMKRDACLCLLDLENDDRFMYHQKLDL